MKMQEHSNKLNTNVEAETQDFGIGDASVVIEILRNRLYEHKVRTLVQEYICNARDSHRELGKGNDFEVTVPTRLNPVFKVRDFGPGINPERMANVFVKYGASTKRGTNGQTGGFGIGAKSAWSYTDSFTITTFVDGTRRTYVAHIGVNNQGRLDLVTSDATEEPNGTEIQIAVKSFDIEEFRLAIFRAIYFWQEKPTLKGELDPPELIRGEMISESVELIQNDLLPEYIRSNNSTEILAVIDGIPYPIGYKLTEKLPILQRLVSLTVNLSRVVMYFGNGIVEVAASRESIADSKNTLTSLKKLGESAVKELEEYVKGKFKEAKETSDYLNTYVKFKSLVDTSAYAKFGDYSIAHGRVVNPLFSKVKLTLVHCQGKYGRGKVDKITKQEFDRNRNIEVGDLGNIFYISQAETPLVQNKRIREFFKTNLRMILVEELHTVRPSVDALNKPVVDKDGQQVFENVSFPNEFKQFVKELSAKDFTSSLTYVNPPKVVREKKKREYKAICLHPLNGDRNTYTTLDSNGTEWVYIEMKEGSWPKGHTKDSLQELDGYLHQEEKKRLCGVSGKNLDLIKGDANFTSFGDWLKALKPSKKLIINMKKEMLENSNTVYMLDDLKGILDPILTAMMDESKVMLRTDALSVPRFLKNHFSDQKEIKAFKELDKEFGALMKHSYPLVAEVSRYGTQKKEIVFYLNAKYQLRKGK